MTENIGLTPMNGWIIVRGDPPENKTSSGILFKPDGAREHLFRRGTVIANSPRWIRKVAKHGSVGVETWHRVDPPIPVGARVLFLFFYGDRPSAGFRAWVGDDNVFPIKPEDVQLYDDPELEGKGIDDFNLSVTRVIRDSEQKAD